METVSRKKIESQVTSNREREALKAEFIDQLVAEMNPGEDIFGPEGSFTRLKGAVMERLLQAELTQHLEGPAEGAPSAKNGRNGFSEKTVQTESGPVRIRVPRDREGTFEPQLVKKHQRRVEGFDEKVLALYARGMTVRDIQGHFARAVRNRRFTGADLEGDRCHLARVSRVAESASRRDLPGRIPRCPLRLRP